MIVNRCDTSVEEVIKRINVLSLLSQSGAQLGGRERGLEPPLAQKWRSYNYSKFDEFFEGVGGRGGVMNL